MFKKLIYPSPLSLTHIHTSFDIIDGEIQCICIPYAIILINKFEPNTPMCRFYHDGSPRFLRGQVWTFLGRLRDLKAF